MPETNFKVINTSVLFNADYNPTLCLSVGREYDQCHKCQQVLKAYRYNTISKLKCKPHIKPKYLIMFRVKRVLANLTKMVNKELKK